MLHENLCLIFAGTDVYNVSYKGTLTRCLGCKRGLPVHFDIRTVRLCPALCPHRGLGGKERKQAESKLTSLWDSIIGH